MSCLGVHFALNADDMAELRQTDLHDEEALQNYLANLEARYLGEEGGEHSAESAKAWDAMNRLLTDGRLEYQNGEYPLNHTVIGGEILIGGGEDDTYIIISHGRNPRGASIANGRNHPDTEGLKGLMQSLTAHAVRQGPRTINGMPGYEKISRWDGNHYLLRWERESDHLLVMMPFGTETFDGTKRSQQEIFAIWDTVLATLKPVE